MSGALVYLIFEAIAVKAFRPHYSYAHNLISDLGMPSRASALAWLMNTAFCLQGSCFSLAPSSPFEQSGHAGLGHF
jgi:hypothetical membrane protein